MQSPALLRSQTLAHLLQSISNLAEKSLLGESFAAYSSLLLLSPPSPLLLRPISSLLSCSSSLLALSPATQLHAHLLRLGLHGHPSSTSRLVSVYSRCGALSLARSIADASPAISPLPWNILISACAQASLPNLALSSLAAMASRGADPDRFTFPSALKACGDAMDLRRGREIHSRALQLHGLDLLVSNALVAMYGKCGDFRSARKVFDEMPQRDSVSWNSIILACAAAGAWAEAFALFERMRIEEREPGVVAWNAIAGGHLREGRPMAALELAVMLHRRSLAADSVTAVIAVTACAQLGLLGPGMELHGVALRRRLHQAETVRNSLMSMYMRCRRPEAAEALFASAGREAKAAGITSPVVAWNCMVSGYAAMNQAEDVARLVREMAQWPGPEPNSVTAMAILSLCGRMADLRCGKEVHGFVARHLTGIRRQLGNSLIDMYCKCGRVEEAKKVFELLAWDRDEVSYTSMIAGFGMKGDGVAAVELFWEMVAADGAKPDGIAMVAVLAACSHGGLVAEAEEIFAAMGTDLRVDPKLEHYSCMVDLYGRAGQLERAEELMQGMPMAPTAAMWAALLAASQAWRDAEVGARAAEELMKVKSENPGHYVLAANMFASTGQWEELAGVRMKMRELGLRKTPGCAWLSLPDGVHAFVVEDRDSGGWEEVYQWLGRLSDHMRDAGYVCHPDLGYQEC
ncbi:pentatricopeptide repeat-containing protein At1g71490-like [Wolffia australiana]